MTTGLEPLFTLTRIEGHIQSDADVLFTAVHWAIISNGFRAIGAGETVPVDRSLTSELLPPGWNQSREVYSVFYIPVDNPSDVYLLKSIPIGSTLLIHFMKVSDESVSDIQLDVAEYCTGDNTSFRSAYRNVEQLLTIIKKDIVSPLKRNGRSSSSEITRDKAQERRSPEGHESGREEPNPLRVSRRPEQRNIPQRVDPLDPFSVGQRDLDPFASGSGGGMVMDPFRSGMHPRADPSFGLPQRLPRGSVPGGARFDPFGPPNPDRFGNPGVPYGRRSHGRPDSDEPPPPDFDDDLYM